MILFLYNLHTNLFWFIAYLIWQRAFEQRMPDVQKCQLHRWQEAPQCLEVLISSRHALIIDILLTLPTGFNVVCGPCFSLLIKFLLLLVRLTAATLYQNPAISYISVWTSLDWWRWGNGGRQQKNIINKQRQIGLSPTHSNSYEHLKNFLICSIIFEVTVMCGNSDLC